ncbi:CDC45-like protein [Vararia minispora EC-137]|uniref:CDC45-like protein n=1 Tax=Vararia minispora EC-137 TaxID=1314806 RepID=A0ACB8QVB6_9AGAM|nr:CDC45-like protein [Vararia minispora EC-137]
MVYLCPPHLASPSRPSYTDAYSDILAAHRRSPHTSASSVIILVAPDVDALCAGRMLAELFKHDDVMHRIVPVAGGAHFNNVCEELAEYTELHTLILLNMGSIMELARADFIGNFAENLHVHIIDSQRPQSLQNLFVGGEEGERVVVWDDGGAEEMSELRAAWEALMEEVSEDGDASLEEEKDDDVDWETRSSRPGKRQSLADGNGSPGKRRKLDKAHPNRISRGQADAYRRQVEKHYSSGYWHAQSTSGTVYILATVLERVDNDLLWLAILGLTYQYVICRISREDYEKYHSIYHDEVARLNPPAPANDSYGLAAVGPDDHSLRTTEELRFALWRHWSLYDAMCHSSYVAGKLGIWKELGRKKLTGLLAKMGFSTLQTQQLYAHMDMDLKRDLRDKLEAIAPEYGMVELSYPSFVRCHGYHTQPLSAADAVEGLTALLDAATGIRMEVEVDGARNGGEWFGGGHVWRATGKWMTDDVPKGRMNGDEDGAGVEDKGEGEESTLASWTVKNFWNAFDALSDISCLNESLSLAKSVHRAIIRTGSSIIDKNDIRMTKGYNIVTIRQGPDLELFCQPGALLRLGLWLADALRDRIQGSAIGKRTRRKTIPLILACFNERAHAYLIVGINSALDFGDVPKNEFGGLFLAAQEYSHTRMRYASFETHIVEVHEADFENFVGEVYRVNERY